MKDKSVLSTIERHTQRLCESWFTLWALTAIALCLLGLVLHSTPK